MKYYGIDITQHKEFCITANTAKGHFHCETEKRNPFLPAALLPEFKHEKVLMASEAGRSRKGLGLLWPREAQIPVGNNGVWENGIGRIPLLSCISNIKAKGEADEWNFIESTISWTPHEKQTITFSNAELLSKVFNNIKDAKQICFVVPEDLGENAQQALLEKFPQDTFLIPRSIAIAVNWCKDHQAEFQKVSFAMERSPSIGYLVCVSLGFGEWEVSLIEIQAQKINGIVHLIPLYDPTSRNHGLSFCGIGLCKQLMSNPNDIGSFWRLICNHAWFDGLLSKEIDNITKQKLTLSLLSAENSGLPYPNLDAMSGLRKKHTLRGGIKSKIISCIEQQKQFHNPKNILGVAVGGSFSKLPVLAPENEKFYDFCPSNSPFVKMDIKHLRHYATLGVYQAQRLLQYRLNQSAQHSGIWTIANFLFPDWERQKKLFIYGADVFAAGASIAACCIGEGIPSFRIKLLPLYLYTISRNKHGDKEENWECLVSESTLNAGETYHQAKPITGLAIPEGKEQLELTLRRPGQNGVSLYRSVVAKISQKTEQKEPVVITANVSCFGCANSRLTSVIVQKQMCAKLRTLPTHMSLTSKSADWIAALNEAVNLQFPNGIREVPYIPELVSDHGCQPTSTALFKACSELGIHQIFASYSNPKGNADTERVIRTIKEDLVWTKEFDSVTEFEAALKQWQKAYNKDYPHSSLGYMTPYEYERWFNASAA